jgi:hypothetical protein
MDPRDRDRQSSRSTVRRMDAGAAGGTEWGYTGGRDAAGNVEGGSGEVFLGWVYGVPDGGVEAVVVETSGEPGTGIVIAARPTAALEAALEAAAAGPGDSFLFCGGTALVILRANGTVELRARGGGDPLPLPTLAGAMATVAWLRKQFDPITGHTHATVGGPPVLATVASATPFTGQPDDPAATEVLRSG